MIEGRVRRRRRRNPQFLMLYQKKWKCMRKSGGRTVKEVCSGGSLLGLVSPEGEKSKEVEGRQMMAEGEAGI